MIDYLIIGGDSLIGSSIYQYLKCKGSSVLKTTRKFGIKNEDSIYFDLLKSSLALPDAKNVFFCIGLTSHELCEAEPVKARLINVDLSITLIENYYLRGSRVVYFSSNAVFDGQKSILKTDTATCPINEYGRQKVEIEDKILSLGLNATVIRMTKIISYKTPLISSWVKTLSNHERIYPFDDLYLSPISPRYVSQIASDHRLSSIVHVSGECQLSYWELAIKLARHLEFPDRLVCRQSIQNLGNNLLYTPKFSKLDMTESQLHYGYGGQSVNLVIKEISEEFKKL